MALVSPYSWLEEYTAREHWLVAIDAPSAHSSEVLDSKLTRAAVSAALQQPQGFSLEGEQQMPFLIREHERKYQWGVSECLIFRRNR